MTGHRSNHRSLRAAACAALLLSGWALASCTPSAAIPSEAIMGKVTDLDRFQQFVALKPTPEQFRLRYPEVSLVLPGDIATKEFRGDNSRYFAELDPQGRIVGGRFM